MEQTKLTDDPNYEAKRAAAAGRMQCSRVQQATGTLRGTHLIEPDGTHILIVPGLR